VSGEEDKLRAEVARLKKALAHSQRACRQVERVAATSEDLARLSKHAMLAQNRELEQTICKLVQAGENLAEAKRQADDANRAKSEFLATMSHEIRTPMNGVLGSLDLLRRSGLDDGQDSLVGVMQASAEHLLTIINDILDFSKIEAGRMELEQEPFRLAETMENALGASRIAATLNGVQLEARFDPELPQVVVGDSHRLRQIVMNLVGNAVKFTKHGSIVVDVTPAGEGRVRFAVVDTGIGISEPALAHIFDEFSQEERGTTRRFGGTGLGLAICKRLVELMGGELTVASTLGVGSTFSFAIDLPAGSATELVARVESSVGGDPIEPRSVLVVDDNAVNLMMTRRMLESLGHIVACASNGREALERLAEVPFDVIFMDCSMPEMDGYEATEAIRGLTDDRAYTPVIALTANALDGDRERCLAAGMDDFVTKPVRLSELAAAISRYPRSAAA